MCGLRTRPRTDVDPPRFLDRTAVGPPGQVSASGLYYTGDEEVSSLEYSNSVFYSGDCIV